MPSSTADAVNDVLRGVQEPGGFGYDNGLGLSQVSAGKTGTIDGNKAVWYAGYTPNLAAVAMLAGANSLGHWITLNGQTVGGAYISEAFGSTYAGPIWARAMQVVDDILPNGDFVAPDPTEVQGQSVTIPSVGGLSTSAASEQLRAAGFQPVIGSSVYSDYSYGTTAYTSPSRRHLVPQRVDGDDLPLGRSGSGSGPRALRRRRRRRRRWRRRRQRQRRRRRRRRRRQRRRRNGNGGNGRRQPRSRPADPPRTSYRRSPGRPILDVRVDAVRRAGDAPRRRRRHRRPARGPAAARRP